MGAEEVEEAIWRGGGLFWRRERWSGTGLRGAVCCRGPWARFICDYLFGAALL